MPKKKHTTAALWRSRIVGHDTVPAGQLLANESNWRIHPKAQSDALRGLIGHELGFIASVIVNKRTGSEWGKKDRHVETLVDGHLRVQLALSNGEETLVPVTYVDLSPKEEALALVTLDPIAALAEPDDEKYDALLELMGPTETDISDVLLAGHPLPVVNQGLTDPDAVPAERETEIVVGDMFELGQHRLLCGDSLALADVERLVSGERAALMNTDPPYGIGYENDQRPNPGVAKPRVANDKMTGEQLQQFLTSAFIVAKEAAVTDNAAWYIWFGNMPENTKFAAAAAANIVLHRNIIWVKPVLLLGRGQYHWKHETCFMGWVKDHQPPDYGRGHGERDQTTIWEVDSVTNAERKEFNQSTPKPVGLFTIPIVKHLRANEIAYDPFAGTGPQFVAAEQLGRRCFGIDIEPLCCQVIIDRWEAFTGRKAKKIN